MSLKELGRLETDVMKAVWRLGRATVRQVRDALCIDRIGFERALSQSQGLFRVRID